MSTSVSDHQRGKGPGNSGKPPINKFNNASKAGDYEEVDSWRNQPQQHHQGYGQASDPYMSSYYGNFQYQQQGQAPFGVNENGPWSNGGGGDMGGFLGGQGGGNYGSQQGMHDSQGGRYDGDGMFTGGNGGGGGRGYNNFSGSGGGGPGFGYGGGYGNGDYSTWGGPQPRKHYDEYYGGRDGMYDGRGVKMIEDGMGGLNVQDGVSDSELAEMMGGGGGSKKTTWASIASQPAKPTTSMKKKPGMPPPPIIPGAWESKNGTVAKAPIAAPVQAPHPAPAWERPKMAPPPPQHHVPPAHSPPSGMGGGNHHGHQGGGPRGGGGGGNYQQHQQMSGGYGRGQQHGPPPHQQYKQQHHSYSQQQQHSRAPPPPPPSVPVSNAPSKQGTSIAADDDEPVNDYPAEQLKKNDYNPPTFDLSPEGARFFVIKSYSEDDIHRSIKYEIWCSTEHGNRRLNEAWKEREDKGPIFLFFSVNGSGHFCGMAQMISNVDYDSSSSVWSQDKWKGQFKVKWIYVKDVPNQALRNIRLENNENKPVTNSRDTQEVPFEKGKQVLKILHTFAHTTSIFDDFTHYEKRQEEEDQRRVVQQQPPPPPHHMQDRNDHGHGGPGGYGGRGRGGYHHGGNHHGMDGHGGGNFGRGRDRDFGGRGGHDNPRDFRDHGDRMDRNHDHHRGGGMDRGPPDHYNGRGDGGNHRDFYSRDRGEYQPRGGMRGRGHYNNMRN